MKNKKFDIAAKMAENKTRVLVHAILLIAGSALFLVAVLAMDGWKSDNWEADKESHYLIGRLIAVIIFYLAYLCIIARVLIIGRGKGSVTKILLWLPTMLAGAMFGAIIVSFLVAVIKEALDMGGAGTVEWLDIEATIDGAFSMAAPVSIIMAATPVFIPLDLIMQLPKLFISDIRTGIIELDSYINEQKSHKDMNKPAEALVVEDDIMCASAIMNFCRKINLKCHHVSTIAEAEDYLHRNMKDVQIVFLDNFLRVDEHGNNTTGSEWLIKMNREFPINRRGFLVVVISGHTSILGEAGTYADLVLQKPWDPVRLLDFLGVKGLIKQQGKAA